MHNNLKPYLTKKEVKRLRYCTYWIITSAGKNNKKKTANKAAVFS